MKKVKTNYRVGRYSYPVCSGNNRKGWEIKLPLFRENAKEFYERLESYGYTSISLYEVTTRIKGFHNLIAYVKRGGE